MVMLTFIIILLLLLISPLPAFSGELTGDQLRLLMGQADREHRKRAARLKAGDYQSLLDSLNRVQENNTSVPRIPTNSTKTTKDKETQNFSTKSGNPVSYKYTPDAPATDTKRRTIPMTNASNISTPSSSDNNISTPTNMVKKSPSHIYIPPPRHGGTKRTKTLAIKHKQQKFGIKIGTWARARLYRNINSADPGMIEFILEQDIPGDRRTLERGTQFFAKHIFNRGTRRWDASIVMAILPDGEEIKIKARVYDKLRVAGLSGTVDTFGDSPDGLEKGVGKGLLAAGSVAIDQLTNNSAISAFTEETAGSVINEKNSELDQTTITVIHIAPQQVKIRIEETL